MLFEKFKHVTYGMYFAVRCYRKQKNESTSRPFTLLRILNELYSMKRISYGEFLSYRKQIFPSWRMDKPTHAVSWPASTLRSDALSDEGLALGKAEAGVPKVHEEIKQQEK